MEGGIEKKNTTLKMILDYKKYQLKKWGPYLTKQKKWMRMKLKPKSNSMNYFKKKIITKITWTK